MQIVKLSRDRLVEMEQVFCEALGVEPKGMNVDVLASLVFAHDTASRLAAAGRFQGTAEALSELDHPLAWQRPAWSSQMF